MTHLVENLRRIVGAIAGTNDYSVGTIDIRAAMSEAADRLEAAEQSIAELLDAYWGNGDCEKPPAFIERAQSLIQNHQ